MDVCPSLISMLSAMVKEHVTAKTKTPLHDSPIVTSVVNLLAAQAASSKPFTFVVSRLHLKVTVGFTFSPDR